MRVRPRESCLEPRTIWQHKLIETEVIEVTLVVPTGVG